MKLFRRRPGIFTQPLPLVWVMLQEARDTGRLTDEEFWDTIHIVLEERTAKLKWWQRAFNRIFWPDLVDEKGSL